MEFPIVEKLLMLAKQIGATELECDGLKVKFERPIVAQTPTWTAMREEATPRIEPVAMTDKEIEAAFKPASPLDDISEDEIKYYATPYYDELQAQKAEHKKKLEEEGIGG
jgi:hypothetical protein